MRGIMNKARSGTDWDAVWRRRGKDFRNGKPTLRVLMQADGYDTACSRLSAAQWRMLAGAICRSLRLRRGSRLLEVGCGAGAMALPLSRRGVRVFGIDRSSPLIALARRAVPGARFFAASADRLPFERGMFDAVLSLSVFQYFSNYRYANAVLKEIMRVLCPGGRVFIADVPDRAKKTASEACRNDLLSKTGERARYRGLQHLYYEKTWFERFARRSGLSFELSDHRLRGYRNAPFRFNVLLTPGEKRGIR